MVSKKQFVSYMDKLEKLSKVVENINKAFKGLDSDFNIISFGHYTTLITTILHDVFEDSEDWIGYWCFEMEYGRKWKKGMVTDKNKKDIPLKTSEDLYNLLTEYLNDKKETKKC